MMIMMYGLLPCWNMEVMKTMTFSVFIGHERHKPFLGVFSFIMGVPPWNFVVVGFLFTSLQKDYFLRQLLQRYRFLISKLQCCWFMIFGYQLLAELQCGIDLYMMPGLDLSSIILTFLYVSVTQLKTSAWLRKHLLDAMFNGYSKFNLLSAFRNIQICQGNSDCYPKDLLSTASGNVSELNILNWKERTGMSHHLLFILRGKRIADWMQRCLVE